MQQDMWLANALVSDEGKWVVVVVVCFLFPFYFTLSNVLPLLKKSGNRIFLIVFKFISVHLLMFLMGKKVCF
jgi:hypothetical protein